MTAPAPKPTSLRAIRDAIQKVAVALVAANDGKPHVIHPQITAEAMAALALLERIILDERPQQSAEPVIPEGWMRDRGKVEDLLVHLESMAWQLDSKGDPDCVDQGQAMAAEVVRQVLIPMLDRAAFPGPSELVEHPNPETQAVAKIRELEKEFRETAETLAGTASAAGVLACADRLSAVIRGTKT